jgi:hypothetical protein
MGKGRICRLKNETRALKKGDASSTSMANKILGKFDTAERVETLVGTLIQPVFRVEARSLCGVGSGRWEMGNE